MITLQTLQAAGAIRHHAQAWLQPIREACSAYDIDTPHRIAAFLAQCAHESMGFAVTTELWGPTAAQRRYEGRADLGNDRPGDGSRFRGHGLIQVTGRANHARVRDRLRQRLGADAVPDFESEPQKLAQAPWAALSAADYWDDRRINALADASDFKAVTRAINGGLNGYEDRLKRWHAVCDALGVEP